MISKQFVLAGEATFTIEIPPQHESACGGKPHRTYRCDKVDANDRWHEAWFVKVLAGTDNTSDYVYVGKLDPFTGQVALTRRSAYAADSAVVRLLNRILARVWAGDHDAFERFGFQLHHEGKCGKCGRKLTTPESVTLGIGPECAKAMGLAMPARARKNRKAQPRASSDAFQDAQREAEFEAQETAAIQTLEQAEEAGRAAFKAYRDAGGFGPGARPGSNYTGD